MLNSYPMNEGAGLSLAAWDPLLPRCSGRTINGWWVSAPALKDYYTNTEVKPAESALRSM